MQYKNDVEQYLDEIRQLLPVSEEEGERFLTRMSESITQYEGEIYKNADYDGLVAYFGSPEFIVKAYTSAWEEELADKKRAAVICKPLQTVVFWVCVFLLLMCIAWLSYAFIRATVYYIIDYGMVTHN